MPEHFHRLISPAGDVGHTPAAIHFLEWKYNIWDLSWRNAADLRPDSELENLATY
jgi:hypothetical protein